jgi:hypothetical protein
VINGGTKEEFVSPMCPYEFSHRLVSEIFSTSH